MRKIILTSLAVLLIGMNNFSFASKRFGETLCDKNEYYCIKVKWHETWEKLFPDPQQRDIVKRVNRMNVSIYPGMTIAIPKNLNNITIYDISPFPRYVAPTGEKIIYVNQQEMAWGAYNDEGELVWWGPISSGSGNCQKLDGKCVTPPGTFRVINKQDINCISTVFPIRSNGINGGAKMPYCMHYYRGFALHGSNVVPGYKASHGCVRMFIEDAKWLNEEFVNLPDEYGFKGTRVIVN